MIKTNVRGLAFTVAERLESRRLLSATFKQIGPHEWRSVQSDPLADINWADVLLPPPSGTAITPGVSFIDSDGLQVANPIDTSHSTLEPLPTWLGADQISPNEKATLDGGVVTTSAVSSQANTVLSVDNAGLPIQQSRGIPFASEPVTMTRGPSDSGEVLSHPAHGINFSNSPITPNTIEGGGGADSIVASSRAETLSGGSGNDAINPGNGGPDAE